LNLFPELRLAQDTVASEISARKPSSARRFVNELGSSRDRLIGARLLASTRFLDLFLGFNHSSCV